MQIANLPFPIKFSWLFGIPFALVVLMVPACAAQTRSCAGLTSLNLPNVQLTATATPAGSPVPTAGGRAANPRGDETVNGRGSGRGNGIGSARDIPVAYCRVQGIIEGTIRFEVWLPDDWNNKFYVATVGGYAGSIGYAGMLPALLKGYATASTDTGHQGGGSEFMKNMQAITNYGYRGVHLTAVAAKKIVTAYYGKDPKYSYLCGCSGGGYAGLANAQRFPDDFDGIASGAPGTYFIHHAARAIWSWQANKPGTPGYIPPEKDKLLWQPVVAACDPLDGVTDGLIENPLACKFDFKKIQCEAGKDLDTCLTPAQVLTAEKLYGPMNDAAGKEIYPATALGTPVSDEALETRAKFYAAFWRDAVFDDAQWDMSTFKVEDVAKADGMLGSALISANPDLSPYKNHGGKLIIYHGWDDPGVSPLNSLEYFQSVEKRLGQKATNDFVRLFLMPGMFHCGGGPGPNTFDMLSVLENWVEGGKAPESVIASHLTDGKVDRTRPICRYPETAHYIGTGSTDDAANFRCESSERTPEPGSRHAPSGH
jgi:feruloyl esterase